MQRQEWQRGLGRGRGRGDSKGKGRGSSRGRALHIRREQALHRAQDWCQQLARVTASVAPPGARVRLRDGTDGTLLTYQRRVDAFEVQSGPFGNTRSLVSPLDVVAFRVLDGLRECWHRQSDVVGPGGGGGGHVAAPAAAAATAAQLPHQRVAPQLPGAAAAAATADRLPSGRPAAAPQPQQPPEPEPGPPLGGRQSSTDRKLGQLQQMGFGREHGEAALQASFGNVGAAVDACLRAVDSAAAAAAAAHHESLVMTASAKAAQKTELPPYWTPIGEPPVRRGNCH
jgi:hypothetical protein